MWAWPLGLLLAGPAPEDAGTAIALRWDAPPGCPSQQDLEKRLQPSLERSSATRADPLHVDARVTREGGKFRTQLHLWRSTGARTQVLVTDTCDTAAEAAVLMITVAAEDPSAMPPGTTPAPVPSDPRLPTGISPSPGPEPEPGPSPHPELSPAPAPELEPGPSPSLPPAPTPEATVGPNPALLPAAASEPSQGSEPGEPAPSDEGNSSGSSTETEDPPGPPSRRVRSALRLSAGVELGALPGVGAGFAGSFALLWPRARFELGASGWLPRRLRLASATARLSLASAHVRGCYVPRARRLEFPACIGTELGAMIGRADGIENATTVALPWVAGTLGASLIWRPVPASRFALVVSSTMAVALTRPRFEILNVGRVHRAGPVGGRFMAGAEVRF